MIFQELAGGARPDGRREHLARPAGRTGAGSSAGGRCGRRPRRDPRGARRRPRPRTRRSTRSGSASARWSRSPARCSDEARCLILDEPTAALSHQEVERLFAFVHRLRERGVAIIYITHRLDEVRRDRRQRAGPARRRRRCSRGASRTSTGATSSRPWSARTLGDVQRPAPRSWELGETPVLRFDGARQRAGVPRRRPRRSARARSSALYGKIGSGTAEVARGRLRRPPARRRAGFELDGNARRASRTPPTRSRAGVGFLPADRQREGAFMVRPVAENLCAPSWPRLARAAALHQPPGSRRVAYRRWHDALAIRSRNDPGSRSGRSRAATSRRCCSAAGSSGGRACSCSSSRRAVSTSARAPEIYRSIRQLAAEAIGVLVIRPPTTRRSSRSRTARVVMARGRVSARARRATRSRSSG